MITAWAGQVMSSRAGNEIPTLAHLLGVCNNHVSDKAGDEIHLYVVPATNPLSEHSIQHTVFYSIEPKGLPPQIFKIDSIYRETDLCIRRFPP